MLVGYARVSTSDQDLTLQTDALTKAGCEKLFTDKFVEFQGGGYADAVCSGTVSIYVALKALELEPGSRVWAAVKATEITVHPA